MSVGGASRSNCGGVRSGLPIEETRASIRCSSCQIRFILFNVDAISLVKVSSNAAMVAAAVRRSVSDKVAIFAVVEWRRVEEVGRGKIFL